ncbi:replication protein [Streptomyces kaniharaensis]|uniref:replication protein n=1 Tax=Streptomyces kaniharaensis TaxID=212423 RepID=UPI0012955547|nr:replication protein [Streptomyces kaniharaensis]
MIVGRSSRGYAVTIGLVRCGKIWFCPECSAAIRRGRSEELKTAALRWLAAGGMLAVVVLTARHNKTTELDKLSDALWGAPKLDGKGNPVLDSSGKPRRTPGAYQAMLTAPAFYGRAARRGKRPEGGIRHRIGYVGMARASEVTRSKENGWHPHMNLLVFLGGRLVGTPAKGTVVKHFKPGQKSLAMWETWLRDLWSGALGKADPSYKPSTECEIRDCKCDGKGHGVKVQIVRSADDAALIDYLTKVQDGKKPADSVTADLKAATGAAMETTRADTKRYTGHSVTPFQLLYRLWDIESAGTDPEQAEGYGTPTQCRAWWAEYEQAMAGRRAIEWTRGLRRHVRMDGDDSEERDREFIYEQEKNQKLVGGIAMTADAHGFVVRADAELDVRATVEAECYDSAADVVAGLGGRADHVRVLTAEQLAEVQEALFARLKARQEERMRQARIAAYEADQAAKDAARRQLAGALGRLLARRS